MKILIISTIIFCANLFGQTINVPSVALQDIDFNIKITDLPDTINLARLEITDNEVSKFIPVSVKNGMVDTSISLNSTGNFIVRIQSMPETYSRIRILPGLLSLIPPLLAILMALILRHVITSLLLGIYVGALFVYDYNPFAAFLRLLDTYIMNALTDVSHLQILVFTFLFGGVVGLISKSGGTRGIANALTKYAKNRKSGMISTWLSGLLIFFDDYANTLIVGNLMRPITDKLKISREKLSFIVDATAAPVASVVIVSSWIGYEIGLIQDGLNAIGSTENAYDIFLQTIPYRFYPLGMLLFVFLIAYFRRDFGPMLKAERKAHKEGVTSSDRKIADLTETNEMFGNEESAKWYNGIVPIFVLIFGTIAGLYFTGVNSLNEQGITDYGLREIIGGSNSYLALLWASFSACVVAVIMILAQRIMKLSEAVDAWFIGVRSMLFAQIILVLAWSIGSVTVDVNTAGYIVHLISDTINPRYLPVLVFLVCALTSFSTGTSWGTMAIMMPIVIPLADSVTGLYNYGPVDSMLILHGVISSVLAGSVFGDHCSPIADTTILSSMASGCNHMDHVRTQLPYAILVAIVAMLIGDLPTAFGLSPFISIIVIVTILAGIILLFGKKVDGNGEKLQTADS